MIYLLISIYVTFVLFVYCLLKTTKVTIKENIKEAIKENNDKTI